jgi:hypothetical protein
MATERQIAANLANSALSTGPRSIEGKAKSCLNAVTHGLAAITTAAIIASETDRTLLEERKVLWASSFRPADESQEWLFERVVVESIRVDRCSDAYFALCRRHGERASDRWDADRRLEAEELAATLTRNPSLIAHRLEATLQGAELMIGLWLGLASRLDRHDDWTDRQRSLALDLLGVNRDLRDSATPVDPAEGDVPAARRALAMAEIARLTDLRDGTLARHDASERAMAERTLGAEFTKPMLLLDRYERAAVRRQQWAWRKLETGRKAGTPAAPVLVPKAVQPAVAPWLAPSPMVAAPAARPLPRLRPPVDDPMLDAINAGFEVKPRPESSRPPNRLERRTRDALLRRA